MRTFKEAAINHLHRHSFVWAALAVGAVTFIIYLPALWNQFVNWDDEIYVINNTSIRSLGTGFVIIWDMTAVVTPLWHPLTNLSYAMDYFLWGLNPGGYHFTNILIHSFNTSLIFAVAMNIIRFVNGSRKEEALMAGVLTALFFGMHPLRVESVAWVSERKDVLGAFFFLVTILFYVRYVSCKDPRKKRFLYACSLISFLFAVMSKPSVVALPIVLLILDYYPFERIAAKAGVRRMGAIIAEKIPFFLLSMMLSWTTVYAQRSTDSTMSLFTYPFIFRILNAGRSLSLYLLKTLFPVNLAPLYPLFPRMEGYEMEYLVTFALFVAISLLIIMTRKKPFIAAWSYYVATLVPVLGIVQVGSQAMADRYTYLPGLAISLIVGCGVSQLFYRGKTGFRLTIYAVLFLALSVSGYKTVRQIGVWHDSISLWSHELKIFPDLAIGYTNLGDAYRKSGDYRESIKNFNIAIFLNPKNMSSYTGRGYVYSETGDYERAIQDLSVAVMNDPEIAETRYNLGIIYLRTGNSAQAIDCFKRAADLGLKEAKEILVTLPTEQLN